MTSEAGGNARIAPKLELEMPATGRGLALIRDQMEAFLRSQLGAGGVPLQEVMLAVQEAIANVPRHAYPDREEPGPIRIRAQVHGDRLQVVVRDEGPGYDPAQVPLPTFGEPRTSGYGLFLIRKVMSRVEVRRVDGANELMMELRLEPAGA